MNLTTPPTGALAPRLDMPRVRRASRAPATWLRYDGAWAQFADYCRATGETALPALPATVCAFLAHYAGRGRAWSSVTVCRSAIGKRHQLAGHADPTGHPDVAATLEAIARAIGTAPRRQAAPLTREQIRAILDTLPADSTELDVLRDRALIAVWWLAACRSDELSRLDLGDLQWRPEGVALQIRRSKTDQTGAGHTVPIPAGPATEALRAWVDTLAAYQIRTGPVWRRLDGQGHRLAPAACAAVLVRRAEHAGITGLTGHSVRAGHVTAAAQAGTPLDVIAAQTGHRRMDTVIRYIRRANLFDQTSAKGLL